MAGNGVPGWWPSGSSTAERRVWNAWSCIGTGVVNTRAVDPVTPSSCGTMVDRRVLREKRLLKR